VGRYHHDGRLGALRLRDAQHVHARGAAAEREVREHEVEGRLAQAGRGLLAGARDLDLVALAPEQAGQREPDRVLVLDDEDAGAHRPSSGVRARRGRLTTNCVPSPGAELTSSWPPWASTIFRVSARPRPVPPCFEV
jgi:hypothetical protein